MRAMREARVPEALTTSPRPTWRRRRADGRDAAVRHVEARDLVLDVLGALWRALRRNQSKTVAPSK
jgi:hypothetical protein